MALRRLTDGCDIGCFIADIGHRAFRTATVFKYKNGDEEVHEYKRHGQFRR